MPTRENLLLKKMGGMAKDLCSLDTLIQFHKEDFWNIGHGMRRASNGADIGPEAREAIKNLRVSMTDDVLALTIAFERAWYFNFGDKDPSKYLPDGSRDWDRFPVVRPSGNANSWVVDHQTIDGSPS